MKKISYIVLALAVFVSVFLAYATSGKNSSSTNSYEPTVEEECRHDWTPADCYSPKMCNLCGETEGDPLGHNIVNGVCTICGYTEWSVKDFGFYNLDKCNKFIDILAYDFGKNIVYPDPYAGSYKVTEFFDNYFESAYYSNSSEIQGHKKKELYSIISNDTISCYEGKKITIIENIVVNEEKDYLIMKCLDSNRREKWYISYDAIDWNKGPVTSDDKDYKVMLYLK